MNYKYVKLGYVVSDLNEIVCFFDVDGKLI